MFRTPALALALATLAAAPFTAAATTTETFAVSSLATATAPALAGKVAVILPSAYDGTKAFPVLVLLHGASDIETAWPERGGDLRALADKYGRVILCPTAGPYSWYNTHNGSEPFIVDTVLPAAAKRYRLTTDRWIAGNSMGGYGTLRLFANHPEAFSGAIALSPGVKPSHWPNDWGIPAAFGPAGATGAEDTFTAAWLAKLPKDHRPLIVICGDADFFFKDFNESLAAAAMAGRPPLTYPTTGAHNWKYWSAELPVALATLAAATARPADLPAPTSPAPAPFGALPTAAQVKWHENPFYAFVHFGPNTFTNREWGFGDEDPAAFAPSAFDAGQIASAAKSAGMTGLIFTAKHHDGLCLWPTKSTPHNISKTPFRAGHGDLVREFADACKSQGLDYGVYVSPWDRNNPGYGTPAYVSAYHQQITELVSNYGPIFEMWFDGASGGDGWYGGKKGIHKVDYNTYYDWRKVRAIIRAKQPGCVIWGAQYSEGGATRFADAHWGGSEKGTVPDTTWSTMHSRKFNDTSEGWALGAKHGDVWCGSEGDVSLRPGWFWHEHENSRVKSPAALWAIYLGSIGHGANLIVNLPPDKRGRLHDNDVASLAAFGGFLKQTFATNLAAPATFAATNTRAGDPGRGPARLVDGDPWSAWCTDDAVTTPSVEITLPSPTTFNLIRLREDIRLGQRVEGVAVDVSENGVWREVATAGSLGACRLWAIPTVTTAKVRLRVTASAACPALSDFGLYLAPAPPAVDFSGKLKPQDRTGWTITSSFAGTDNARSAIDGDPSTCWNTHGNAGESGLPQSLTLDLGKVHALKGFTALPRQDGCAHGLVDRYRAETSLDGKTWTKAAEGEFANIRANPVEQTVLFAAPVSARHLRLTALTALEKHHASFAELGILE